MKSLSVRGIEALRPFENRIEIPDAALPGMYFVVQPSGSKSFALRYRAAGKTRKFTLGSYPMLSLADAREKAQAALRAVAEGKDPAGDKKARAVEAEAAEADSARFRFSNVATDFVRMYAKIYTRGLKADRDILAKTDLAPWQDRDIRTITKRDVLDVLDAMAARGAATGANRMLALLRKFFGWTVEREILTVSPSQVWSRRARSRGEIACWATTNSSRWNAAVASRLSFRHGCAHPYSHRRAAFGSLWRPVVRVRSQRCDLADPARALQEFERARVPLATLAIEVIESIPRLANSQFVFHDHWRRALLWFREGNRSTARRGRRELHGGNRTRTGAFTLHDLRRSFASGSARLGVPIHVTGRNLNHLTGLTVGGLISVLPA